MSCECVKKVNAQLAPQGLRLALSYDMETPGAGVREHIQVQTAFIARRRGRPTAVVATFCPFCGVKLHGETWTTEAPTKPGWYWWRSEKDDPRPVQIWESHQSGLAAGRTGPAGEITRPAHYGGEWGGLVR